MGPRNVLEKFWKIVPEKSINPDYTTSVIV